ncbi:hypothetical protein CVIRNUC_010520 [Coccomyxa viridis]|uniref:Uncharacterized protein n=1 Tax=Coccomyxa viridis TaxID=1274662 RepID=A0AAV1IM48_9CHLO|nr:hypothetical protein CVIRNUC_010520 [Coccomyxa viridis]
MRPRSKQGRGSGPPQGNTSASSAALELPPVVYHIAESANWPFIEKEGLQCAATLMRQSSLDVEEIKRCERQQRTSRLVLPDGRVLRDQCPVPATALERCLVNMSPPEWYSLLNSQIFFWVDVDRLNRVRKVMIDTVQFVAVVDTAALLAKYGASAAVTPFNIGNARRKASQRSNSTLVPYTLWQSSGWQTETEGVGGRPRARSHKAAELVVDTAIPDFMDFVLEVRRLAPGQLMERWV